MDEDGDIPNVHKSSKQLEEPDNLGNEELMNAEEYLSAPDPSGMQRLSDASLSDEPKVRESNSVEGLSMGYAGCLTQTDSPAAKAVNGEPITGEGLPMECAGNQLELDLPAAELNDAAPVTEEGLPMGYAENHTETPLLVAEPEFSVSIAEEGLLVGYVEEHTEMDLPAAEPRDAAPIAEGGLPIGCSDTDLPAFKVKDEVPIIKGGLLMGCTEEHTVTIGCTDTDLPAFKVKDEVPIIKGGLLMGCTEEHTVMDLPAAELKDEVPIIEGGLPILCAEEHTETDLAAAELKDEVPIAQGGLPIGCTDNHMETDFPEAEPIVREAVAEECLPMGYAEKHTEMVFLAGEPRDGEPAVLECLPTGHAGSHTEFMVAEPKHHDWIPDEALNDTATNLQEAYPKLENSTPEVKHIVMEMLVVEPKNKKLLSEEALPIKHKDTVSNLQESYPKLESSISEVKHTAMVMPVVEHKNQESLSEEALSTEKEMDAPVVSMPWDNDSIAEKVLPMEHATVYSGMEVWSFESKNQVPIAAEGIPAANTYMGTNLPVAVPKDVGPSAEEVRAMLDAEVHKESHVQLAEPKGEDPVTEVGLPVAYTKMRAKMYMPGAELKGEGMAKEGFPQSYTGEEVAEADVLTNVRTGEVEMANEAVEGLSEVDTEIEVAGAMGVGTDNEDTETDGGEAETGVADMELKVAGMEIDMEEVGSAGVEKRKRGRNSKASPKVAPKKKIIEEDVCFICFDGGDLVICDRRGCPKAYHPSCVNRDEAFFRAKGRWNCGWHICSICEKNSHYMCYTCTYSLCKGCIKDGALLSVRGNKGLCETCMRTVLLIEKNEQGNQEMGHVDFDDKNCWEFLFKDYWTDLKGSLGLALDELLQAKNPWKPSDAQTSKQEIPHDTHDAGSDSEHSENQETSKPKKRKGRRLSKSFPKEISLPEVAMSAAPGPSEWASKELMEFVMHMKNGDGSVLSQFDVQALLLEYIKINKLRDPRKKSQIICDSRLENLFGKARVGHFEMLKLLESHFLLKKDSQVGDLQGQVVDSDASQLEVDGNADTVIKSSKDRKRKARKKADRGPQSNLDDYAAIDMHNINLIYLRRNLMEDLIGDGENFHGKVVNSFVRIRISGSGQKQDIYRLVQVVGTSKAARPYKIGKRTTHFMLNILNLSKIEAISIDIISNQDFTEDECKRLRQSIKCGLINRLSVGDILEKAMTLHAVRVNDWLEAEMLRLTHLRDRASEKDRRKELRECVEKLQLLKTAEERQRRLEEIPEVHADPKMDPSHESEDDDDNDDKVHSKPSGTSFGHRAREPVSPGGTSGANLNDFWGGSRRGSSKNLEPGRNSSDKDHMNNENAGDNMFGASRDPGRLSNEPQPNNGGKQKTAASPAAVALSLGKTNEADKVWHYKDPSGKVQGPFSMVQLRKWNNTGYFPADLRIWNTATTQDDSVLLADALLVFFPKEDAGLLKSQNPLASSSSSTKLHGERTKFGLSSLGQNGGDNWKPKQEHTPSKAATQDNRPRPDLNGINHSTDLPSPVPLQTTTSRTGVQASEPVQCAGPALESTSLTSPAGPGAHIEEPSRSNSHLNPSLGADGSNGSTVSHPSFSQQSTMEAAPPTPVSNSSGLSTAGGPTGSVPPNTIPSVTPLNPNPTVGWGPAMMVQPSGYSQWVPSQSSVNSNPNPAGGFATPGLPTFPAPNLWRLAPDGSSNVQSQNLPWGMAMMPENQNLPQNLMPGNSSMGWGASPNMNWAGQGPPGAHNMNWAPNPQGLAPGNTGAGPAPPNMNWGAAAPVGSVNPGGVVVPPNVNWVSSVQGPVAGNTNPSWGGGVPTGGSGMWGGEQSQNVNRPWNRPQFGGGRGGGHREGTCWYYETGNCRWGASCNYFHAPKG